jgi:hypothetical protein
VNEAIYFKEWLDNKSLGLSNSQPHDQYDSLITSSSSIAKKLPLQNNWSTFSYAQQFIIGTGFLIEHPYRERA